jgi:hypothetical protein
MNTSRQLKTQYVPTVNTHDTLDRLLEQEVTAADMARKHFHKSCERRCGAYFMQVMATGEHDEIFQPREMKAKIHTHFCAELGKRMRAKDSAGM